MPSPPFKLLKAYWPLSTQSVDSLFVDGPYHEPLSCKPVMVSVETLLDNDSQAAVQVMMEKIDGANNLPFQILTWQNQADNATPSLFSNQMNSFVIAHYFEPTI